MASAFTLSAQLTAAPRVAAAQPGRRAAGCAAARACHGAALQSRLASARLAATAARPAQRGRRSVPAPRASAAEGTASKVLEVDSEAEFDRLLKETSADKLLIVECSATWCGPCKLFKPAYEQFAQGYSENAVFTSIMGDANASTAAVMKRLGVKSVPAFFFYKGGEQVASFTGANKQGFRNQLAQFIPL